MSLADKSPCRRVSWCSHPPSLLEMPPFLLLPYSFSLPPSPRDSLFFLIILLPSLQSPQDFGRLEGGEANTFLREMGRRQGACQGVMKSDFPWMEEAWELRDTHLAVGVGGGRQHCLWAGKSHNLCKFKKSESVGNGAL